MTSYRDTPEYLAAQQAFDRLLASELRNDKYQWSEELQKAAADLREQDRLWREDTDRQARSIAPGFSAGEKALFSAMGEAYKREFP